MKLIVASTQNGERLSTLLQDLPDMGVQAQGVVGDVTHPEDAGRMAQESLTVHGDMDAMVCVAGAPGPGKLAERSVEQWNLTFNLNTRSVLLMAQAAYPSLKRKRGSLIKGATPEASEMTGFALSSFHNYSLPHRSTYANNRHDRPRHREQLAQAWSHFGPAFFNEQFTQMPEPLQPDGNRHARRPHRGANRQEHARNRLPSGRSERLGSFVD